MRVALVHNPKAGDNSRLDGRELRKLIRAAGHEVTSRTAKSRHLAALLDDAPDLVAIAGGDGTVAKVATMMAGTDIPLATLPIGTANNIARTLGVADIAVHDQVVGWNEWTRTPFDIGLARGPWGTRHFVESVGAGLVAWSIPKADAHPKLESLEAVSERLAFARRMLAQRLKKTPLVRCEAMLDGEDISGDYVLFEAMNIRAVGPNLELAPRADPGDGLLDVVTLSSSQGEELRKALADGANLAPDHDPGYTTYRGRNLRMEWTNYDLHFDDDVWHRAATVATKAKVIQVRAGSGKVEFLVPRAPVRG